MASMPQATEDCLDLLGRMMTFDPRRRITADEALQHRYFTAAPAATAAALLPRPPLRASQPLVLAPKVAPTPAAVPAQASACAVRWMVVAVTLSIHSVMPHSSADGSHSRAAPEHACIVVSVSALVTDTPPQEWQAAFHRQAMTC